MSKQIVKHDRLVSLQIPYILKHYEALRFYSQLREYSGNIYTAILVSKRQSRTE